MVLDLRDGDILLQRMFEKDRNPLESRKTVIPAYKTSVGTVLCSFRATTGSRQKKRSRLRVDENNCEGQYNEVNRSLIDGKTRMSGLVEMSLFCKSLGFGWQRAWVGIMKLPTPREVCSVAKSFLLIGAQLRAGVDKETGESSAVVLIQESLFRWRRGIRRRRSRWSRECRDVRGLKEWKRLWCSMDQKITGSHPNQA